MSTRPHFRIAGIPVRVEPFFVVVAVFMGIDLQPLWLLLAWVVIVFVSVLVHELGHAVALKVFGQRSSIVLHGFGGFTVSTRKLSRRRSIAVSLAGSLTALLLLGLPARALLESDWAQREHFEWLFISDDFNWWPILSITSFVNIWWSVANLLPIRPLDGGNIATELFGLGAARRLSVVFAVIGGVYAYVEDYRFATFFALMLGLLNLSEIRAERRGGASDVFDVDAPDPPAGGKARRAPHLRSVPPGAPAPAAPAGPPLLASPSLAEAEARAWRSLRDGDAAAAVRALGPFARDEGTNPFLRASLVLAGGRTDAADDLFVRAYTAAPGGPPNLVPATLLSEHGRALVVAGRLVADGRTGAEAAGTLQTHLHYAERYRDAAEVGELVFAAGAPSPAQTAFEVACSWSRAGEATEAVRWVETAVDAGFGAGRLLDGEPDLEAARTDPAWPAVRARVP